MAGALASAGLPRRFSWRPQRLCHGLRRVSAGVPEKRLPLFREKFPHIDVQIFAEPIGDMLAKTAVAMVNPTATT